MKLLRKMWQTFIAEGKEENAESIWNII